MPSRQQEINLVGIAAPDYDDIWFDNAEDGSMPIVARIRLSLQMRWYRSVPTERLILKIKRANGAIAQTAVLNSLKERLAFQDGTLEAVDWSKAYLDGAVLSSCRLSSANFCQGRLRGAYFAYSDLRHVNFEGANLFEAHLREADLSFANLTRCNLQRANLAYTHLANARLEYADLSHSNLWETNLCGANLAGARLTGCKISGVKTDCDTILPDETPCLAASELQAFAEQD